VRHGQTEEIAVPLLPLVTRSLLLVQFLCAYGLKKCYSPFRLLPRDVRLQYSQWWNSPKPPDWLLQTIPGDVLE
jgi:hypothetical protein